MGGSHQGIHKAFFACVLIGVVLLSSWSYITNNAEKFTDSFQDPQILTYAMRKPTRNGTIVILDYTGYIVGDSDYFVQNCYVTRNRTAIKIAKAVVIANRKLLSLKDLPTTRDLRQRWVWLLDESPYHPLDSQPFTLHAFKNFYNWTMTYRTNSDVYAPYGVTMKTNITKPSMPEFGKRKELVSAVISNCHYAYVHNRRMEYINKLKKTVRLTLYGACGKPCSAHDKQGFSPCPEIKNHLFHLAFENGNCKEYISEKPFANGFAMGAVPIVMGALKEDYRAILPPNSFIHVSDFKSPKELGEYLTYLSKNETAYMEFHEWRKSYRTTYRAQFEDKSIWIPLCRKLNTDNGVPSTVKDLNSYWTKSECNGNVPW